MPSPWEFPSSPLLQESCKKRERGSENRKSCVVQCLVLFLLLIVTFLCAWLVYRQQQLQQKLLKQERITVLLVQHLSSITKYSPESSLREKRLAKGRHGRADNIRTRRRDEHLSAHLLPRMLGKRPLSGGLLQLTGTATNATAGYVNAHNLLFDIDDTGKLTVLYTGYHNLYFHVTVHHNLRRVARTCGFQTVLSSSEANTLDVVLMYSIVSQSHYDETDTVHQSGIFYLIRGQTLHVRPDTSSHNCELLLNTDRTFFGGHLLRDT